MKCKHDLKVPCFSSDTDTDNVKVLNKIEHLNRILIQSHITVTVNT